jgi:hypothetical protein
VRSPASTVLAVASLDWLTDGEDVQTTVVGNQLLNQLTFPSASASALTDGNLPSARQRCGQQQPFRPARAQQRR